jgi:hypothetical protein
LGILSTGDTNMKALVLIFALAATTFAATLADVSGDWSVDGEVYGTAVKYTCNLTQEGEKLSGTAKLDSGDAAVTGSVADKSVTWQFEVPYNGQMLTLVFDGTVESEKSIKGKIQVAGIEGAFSATKN